MFIIPSNFISNFKIGDNINHNLAILALLYDAYGHASSDDRRRLCKPITVTLASIIEACLYDFHKRAKRNTWEGIVGLASEALDTHAVQTNRRVGAVHSEREEAQAIW